MSLLGKNILNDLLKTNGNKTILNSSNILNKTSKYNKISKNQLIKKIETTEIDKEDSPNYLIYFLHNAFDGNHDLLGFKFLWYYLTESEKIKNSRLNPENIYKNYFKQPNKVKEILSYFLNDFYDNFLKEVIDGIKTSTNIDVFIKNIKHKFPDTYYQILPFNLLIYYDTTNISTEISRKFNEIGNNPTFIDFSIKLYNIYNEQTSPELMDELFPYLLKNLQFQILIADMGLKKIGKGIGDKLWIYKDGENAGILTSNKKSNIKNINFGIANRVDTSQITEEEYRFLMTYKNFIKLLINEKYSGTRQGHITFRTNVLTNLMKLQVGRLNSKLPIFPKDAIKIDKTTIRIKDFEIPYRSEKNNYYFTLGSQEYQFQINKDNVVFLRDDKEIFTFKKTKLIEIPYEMLQGIYGLTINEILLIIISILI